MVILWLVPKWRLPMVGIMKTAVLFFCVRFKGLSIYNILSVGYNQPHEETVQTFGFSSSDTY